MKPFTYLETLLEVKDVSLDLGGRKILRDVNLQIKNIHRAELTQGQVVGFLGPSGVGKTQLFRILAGLNKPDTGTVVLTEKQIPVHPGMIGVVAQSYPLFEHRTVWGNLTLAGRLAGLDEETVQKKALMLLERFQLGDKAAHYAAEISGGQRQRVAIAQQLMCSSHFLLMDEPFSGLDPVMKDEACRLISEVAAMDELMTIIIVTHDIAAAVQVSDMLWLMGRDRAPDGTLIPGAYIKEQINLAERGLAWHHNVDSTEEFAACIREIRTKFNSL